MGRRLNFETKKTTIDPDAGVACFADEAYYFQVKAVPPAEGAKDKAGVWLECGNPKRGCLVGGRDWYVHLNDWLMEVNVSDIDELHCDRIAIHHKLDKAERKQLARLFKKLLPKKHFSTKAFPPGAWPAEDIPIINNGRACAGFAVFYRTNGDLSPGDLINRLGLTHYEANREKKRPAGYLLTIADDGQWTHLLDEYSYALWYDNDAVTKIRQLAREFETLIVGFPDTDNSFDIEYWRDGFVRRKISFDDNWGKYSKPIDVGPPFEAESTFTLGKEPEDALWQVIASLGINTDYNALDFDVYSFINNTAETASSPGFNTNKNGLLFADDLK